MIKRLLFNRVERQRDDFSVVEWTHDAVVGDTGQTKSALAVISLTAVWTDVTGGDLTHDVRLQTGTVCMAWAD